MAGDEPLREAEKPKVNEGQARGARDASAEWNAAALDRRAAALSPEERAERAAVAQPRDGVGCRFGEVPGRQAIKEAIDRLSPEKKALLKNPDAVVTVNGRASRVGSAEFNQRLSTDRATAVAEYLSEDNDVRAVIISTGEGFEEAVKQGHAADKDNRNDRVVTIDVVLEKKAAPDKTKPAPEKPKQKEKPGPEKKEGSESGKTEIPRKYADGYVLDRKTAESRYYQTVERAVMGLKYGLGVVAEAFKQWQDSDRYQREMEAAKSVDEKLWGVRPMRGFLFELEKPKGMEQWKVKNWLREGGYEPDKMLKEYVIHWLRKGVI